MPICIKIYLVIKITAATEQKYKTPQKQKANIKVHTTMQPYRKQ